MPRARTAVEADRDLLGVRHGASVRAVERLRESPADLGAFDGQPACGAGSHGSSAASALDSESDAEQRN
jgi:hypothetical protein